MRVWQEFYCGECQGYILLKVNVALDHRVIVVCPNCGHEHYRKITKGKVEDDTGSGSDPKEKLTPVKSAYSKEPSTKFMLERMKRKTEGKPRAATTIEKKEDLCATAMVGQLWQERHAGKSR